MNTSRIIIVREDPCPSGLAACDSPESAAEFWRDTIAAQPDYESDKESLCVILLDTRLRPTAWHRVSLGSLNETIAHPRDIIRPAVVSAAYAFILTHNHPSGDPAPSRADREITRRVAEGTELLQVKLIDHVIIGAPSPHHDHYFSFQEAGLL